MLAAAAPLGCHRGYYRERADAEAYALMAERSLHPHWPLENPSIQVDPRSRMYYPFDPDRPPMPPDDPAAHRLMHYVDGKPGFPHWDENGFTQYVESPDWEQYLPRNANGVVVIDEAAAVRLALLHSRDYQSELETLYLSALDVSAERFRFDAQFFGGNDTFFTTTGPDRSFPGGNSSSVLENNSSFAVQKAFVTGAELAVGLANSLVWQFSGDDTFAASTVLDFSLVQPLLRGAGRDRIMETLTIAERALLANVRQMERFRRGFYTETVTGTGGVAGPSRRGGFFGGSGLSGFAGVGGGGFGRLGGGGGGGGGGAFAGAQGAGGFIGLLQTQQNIRNLESNIASLRSSLSQLEAFAQAGRINFFQVELARQDLFQNQSQLLNARRAYQDQLDSYKIQLGLPPQLEVAIEDPMLDAFNLIDPSFLPVQNGIAALQQRTGLTIVSILAEAERGVGVPPVVVWDQDLAADVRMLTGVINDAEDLRQRVLRELIPMVLQDIAALREAIPRRQTAAGQLRETLMQRQRQANGESVDLDVSPSLFETAAVESLPTELEEALRDPVARLEAHAQDAEAIRVDMEQLLMSGPTLDSEQLLTALRNQVFAPLPALLNDLSSDILDVSLVQARARSEMVSLVPVDISAADALEIARHYRRDWMNARVALVDAWRLIEFNADNLESTLNLVFSGDIRNASNDPFNLRADAGLLRMGVQFDAPFTRLLERNTYRQSLIEYNQARRSFYEFEDGVAASLRGTVRQIELNQVNFELRRAALRVAANQVELARLQLQEPPPVAQVQGESSFGENTARDLVQALSALRNAQDDFLSVWVNYEVLRRLLDLNMGTMQLDSEGVWIDPGPIGLEFGYPVSELPADPAMCVAFPELQPVAPADAAAVAPEAVGGTDNEQLGPAAPFPPNFPAEQLPAPQP